MIQGKQMMSLLCTAETVWNKGLKKHCFLAGSKRPDSGEQCEVKKAIKRRGRLGREVPFLTSPPPSLLFFRSLFLLHTAPHYLNDWNRLTDSQIVSTYGMCIMGR